ncbi:hypothetical protein LINPERPRIM_LOCUS37787 [Linum perenne]
MKLLADGSRDNHHHIILTRLFQEMKGWSWEISIKHIYRETKNAANFLANSGHAL